MTKNSAFLAVVAGALLDAGDRLLLQRALPGKRHAGLWEFPGGKIEQHETAQLALRREIDEELGLDLSGARLVRVGSAREERDGAGEPACELLLYSCRGWKGQPEGRDGQEWAWFSAAEAAALPLAAMDRTLLAALARREGWKLP